MSVPEESGDELANNAIIAEFSDKNDFKMTTAISI